MIQFNALEVERYVKARFPDFHQHGGEWRGPCPVHGGSRDSFAVNAETGQAYCHSECAQGWDLVGLEAALANGDMKQARREVFAIIGRTEAKNGDGQKKEIERTYPYQDAAGRLLFEVVRFKPKDFRQRRPDGKGGWVWNLQGVEPVLFRLPKLTAAEPGSRVFVCEGERDVETAEKLGFLATCNPMGAGKWKHSYSSVLAKLRPVVIPDNDEPGRKHARTVVDSLLAAGCDVRVLELPSAKDLSEYIANGGDAATVSRLADEVQVEAGWYRDTNHPEHETPSHERETPRLRRETAAAAEPERGAAWRLSLTCGGKNNEGAPKKTLSNAVIAVSEAPELAGAIVFDEFRHRITKVRPLPWDKEWTDSWAKTDTVGQPRPWTDRDDAKLLVWLERQDILVNAETAHKAVVTVAGDNPRHELRDWLKKLEWDGEPRIDSWLTDCMGVPRTEYTSAVGAAWLISAVARVFQPGCKAEHILVIEGDQGVGKSTAASILGGGSMREDGKAGTGYFSDNLGALDAPNTVYQLSGKWIIEIAELGAIRKTKEVEQIKAFLSKQVDTYRPVWARNAVDVPRQCVFIGTCNESTYFRDETGNRRFWPIRASRVDTARLAAERDQLWAEAVDRYNAGSRWWLTTSSVIEEAKKVQASRMDSDPWGEQLRIHTRTVTRIPSTQIWEKLHVPVDRRNTMEGRRIGILMRQLGFRRGAVRWEGAVVDGWIRPLEIMLAEQEKTDNED